MIDIKSLSDEALAELRETIDNEANQRLKKQLGESLAANPRWFETYEKYIAHPLYYNYCAEWIWTDVGQKPETNSESYQQIISRVANFTNEQLEIMLKDIAVDEIHFLRHYVAEGTPPKSKDQAGTVLLLLVADELHRRANTEEHEHLLDYDSHIVTDCDRYINYHLDHWKRRFQTEE